MADAFDPTKDISCHQSISARRRNKALDLDIPSRNPDSFRVTDTSYTRQNIKIDNQGITSQDEEKTITPDHQSFIKDISEIQIFDGLGSGATGYVSQAIHIPTKTMIAIKQISVYEKNRRNQIMNEFNALENTNCNGLVEFHGIFFSKGSVLIALEYCECGSLYDILKKVKIIPEQALGVMCINILEGLNVLHNKKKQVHRDLKPSNLVLNARGEAKITDFGISRELKDTLGKCRSYVGTRTYMSPERIRAQPYSFKSDIWALGLTLMECAVGQFPYPHAVGKYWEMIQHIAMDPPPSLPNNMKFSQEFQDFLQQCIQKDPTKRPTAKQLKQHKWVQMNLKTDFDIVKWIKDNNLIIKISSDARHLLGFPC